MPVDLALQSFKKPELLIYTLLSLHSQCAAMIDTVFVRDDSGDPQGLDFLKDPELVARLAPWKIRASASARPSGWSTTLYTPRMQQWRRRYSGLGRIKALIKRGLGRGDPVGDPAHHRDENDIRYQWAINQTDKAHLLILHDDVQFHADIVTAYLKRFQAQPDLAIIGQLGQCWRCGYQGQCSPAQIMAGALPPHWPLSPVEAGDPAFPQRYQRACRVNEWCCMISVPVARALAQDGIYFGNYEEGDVAAYWFAEIVKRGLGFADDFAAKDRDRHYIHAWQGHSGHSVWVDQGQGKSGYRAEAIAELVAQDFGYRPRA